MINFEAELERLPPDAQLREALSRLFGCNREDVSVVHEEFDSLEKPVACVVFGRKGGQFAAMVSVYADVPFSAALESQSLIEKGASFAKLLQTRVVVSNDDTENPYSMILIDPRGDAAVVDVNDEVLDDGDLIEIARVGPFGPVFRLSREDLVTMLLENGICRREDIAGIAEDDIAAIEDDIGASFPWQFREFMLAVGQGAGAYLHGEGFFADRRQVSELLQQLGQTHLDLQPLTSALHRGRGVYPLSVTVEAFRFFKLGTGQDPVIHEWRVGMDWPRPTWSTLSGFLISSAKRCLSNLR